ncbi:MAG: chemotaxis protein CheA [Planctomycetes bacterium]|nr:chemotaxis protein CheA [Planctomycetota bacterium]
MSHIDKHKETFKEEAYELLGELETAFLELEESPDNRELVGRVFRAMHTIKGSGAMFGFDDIAEFMHDVETVFEQVRDGKIAVTKHLVNLGLSAKDQIRAMLDAYGGNEPADESRSTEIIAAFRKLISRDDKKSGAAKAAETGVSGETNCENIVYRIHFRPEKNIFMNGTNPIYLLNELKELGECRAIAHVDTIPPIHEINPEYCYTHWDIILTTGKGVDAIKDIFIFIADNCELNIKVVDGYCESDEAADNEKLGNILVDRGIISPDDIEKALSSQKRLGEILVDAEAVTNEGLRSALEEQSQIRDARKKRQTTETHSNIRVPAEKLDHFVDLVGELVILQQRLSRTASRQNDSELFAIAEEVERLTVELRDSAFSVRMVPIGMIFNKLKRLVRDLSDELGKETDMATDGGETELDKTVIDRLNDPLVHIIRNSIDHGIELPGAREASGKPGTGVIHLSAFHSGSSVIIQIRDDGRGIDTDIVRARAIEKGMVAANAELSEKECYALIFEPGFSTAKEVTSVSGRGVGMDVVKQTIDSLRGSIDVESKKGKGTTITITLPLTLAIIEGLQVEIGNEYFVLPLSAVEECIELTREEALKAKGRHITNVRGEIVPYIRLKDWFFLEGNSENIEQIVITRTGDRRVGFVVDRVVGEHQTVIKALGSVYKNVQGVSGATILGDGRVAMIIDIPHLIQAVEMEENSLCA